MKKMKINALTMYLILMESLTKIFLIVLIMCAKFNLKFRKKAFISVKKHCFIHSGVKYIHLFVFRLI